MYALPDIECSMHHISDTLLHMFDPIYHTLYHLHDKPPTPCYTQHTTSHMSHSHGTSHTLYPICHTLPTICHTTHSTCHVLHLTFYTPDITHLKPPITSHTVYSIQHILHSTRYMQHKLKPHHMWRLTHSVQYSIHFTYLTLITTCYIGHTT